MFLDYLLTPIIIISLMTVWIGIQFAWKKLFSETLTDEDVLAMRKGCGGCHLGEECSNNDDKCEKKQT
jgi:hypothetical protein